MSWTMNVNPLGNLALSALVAFVPILFLFTALTVLKMKGYWAAIIATSLAVGVACIAYGMPVQYAGLSVVYGALFGLFPVSWIVITALFIYNMSVKTGQFEVVKNSLATISDDRRMQALLIAFSFGAFIEGAAGSERPWQSPPPCWRGSVSIPSTPPASVFWPTRPRLPSAPSVFPLSSAPTLPAWI